MYCTRKITDDLIWIGSNDRQHPIFEAAHPVPRGMSYNSYLLLDEKTVLFDTVDRAVQTQFMENLEHALNGRALDYIFVHHMEPDHAATLGDLMLRHPEAKIVCNGKAVNMIRQFHAADPKGAILVNEGDTLSTGRHHFTFVAAPMVHWPEVVVSYDSTDKILFSADGFGSFGALNGVLFADEIDWERDWLDEARRYYTNIVGKYGPQVMALLNKASKLDIQMICPLHGPIWRKDFGKIIDRYVKWASYEPEVQGVVIPFASIYGNTETAASILACRLAELGVPVEMYDVSSSHYSYVLSDCFKYSHIVFACPTYNNGIFDPMEHLLRDLAHHNLQNRKVALIQNGSWAPASGKLMTEILSQMKNMELLEAPITLKSALAPGQESELEALAQALAASVKGEEPAPEVEPAQDKPRGFVCKICGFIYESDTLPEDYTCPICRRPASDFEPVQ
ncbi:Anaerobic nitric oxide reductase flavorubredoxin [Firmicutes bacterium ASF500]|nr:Anaerobic nitric oxide reductase flavorubredoxin [Firmicutes bacterium ASF500]